jgi:ribosomal protein S4
LQSWHPRNLFNLWRRSEGDRAQELDFKNSRTKLFDSRWKSKALVRAYHGDVINERIFKRWYLPETLPDVRPTRRAKGDDALELAALAGRGKSAVRQLQKEADDERHANAPVGSLMFAEVERRLDTFIFRCCFAHSIYEARRMVIHGSVKLNGVKVRHPFLLIVYDA